MVSRDSVRLASSLPYQVGHLECTTKNMHQSWAVEIKFSVTGRKIGGKGFAFWYVTQDNNAKTELFGKSANFHGLAVIFDSSDMDHGRSIPFIHAITNDGTKEMDDFDEYGHSNVSLGSCYDDYRNTNQPGKRN